MGAVGVVDAFLFLKAQPETRDQIERRLRKKLDTIMSKWNPRVASAVRRGEQPDYDRIFEEMRAAIQPEVTALTTTEALRLSVDTGIVFDPAVINADAVEWARTYTYDLVTGITDTERKLVRQVERTFFETPGMTQGDLERLLGHAFGPVRAEMIAVTETTRAAAEGTNEAQRLLNETGYPMIRVWSTANDDLVCPICGPLNGQPESVWSGEFGRGPPAHPRCRCSSGLSAMDESVHLEEARQLSAERDVMLRDMGLLPDFVTTPAFAEPDRIIGERERKLIADLEETREYYQQSGDENVRGIVDTLEQSARSEAAINKALWDQYGITPEEATPGQWRRVADNLEKRGYDAYQRLTKTGIMSKVQEKRNAQDAGYMIVGKEQIAVKRGAFSVRTARRMQGTMWADAKDEMTDAAGKLLKQAGFTEPDIGQASYAQRMRLLEELGQKEVFVTARGTPSKIDAVPTGSRAMAVERIDYDLAATCENSAVDPLAMPTIDAYQDMELADQVRAVRLGE